MGQSLPLHHWDIPQPRSIKEEHTGLLNQTFLIITESGFYVLQKLHPAVALPGATKNYYGVTELLSRKGKSSQRFVKTKRGQLWVKHNGFYWRLLIGVPGNVYTSSTNSRLGFEAGKLLGDFHKSLRSYRANVHKTLPMFQYGTVLRKLRHHERKLMKSDSEVQSATQLLITELPKLLLSPKLPQQVIHTDPKISNFIFNNQNRGVCMIDLDTIQKLSPLYDIGDAVRSMCGQEEDDPKNKFNRKMYEQFLKGYLTKNKLSAQERHLISQACKLVMLGLAARFLNDYIDDNYFGWDARRYKNRKAHNRARVLGQISLYKSFIRSTASTSLH